MQTAFSMLPALYNLEKNISPRRNEITFDALIKYASVGPMMILNIIFFTREYFSTRISNCVSSTKTMQSCASVDTTVPNAFGNPFFYIPILFPLLMALQALVFYVPHAAWDRHHSSMIASCELLINSVVGFLGKQVQSTFCGKAQWPDDLSDVEFKPEKPGSPNAGKWEEGRKRRLKALKLEFCYFSWQIIRRTREMRRITIVYFIKLTFIMFVCAGSIGLMVYFMDSLDDARMCNNQSSYSTILGSLVGSSTSFNTTDAYCEDSLTTDLRLSLKANFAICSFVLALTFVTTVILLAAVCSNQGTHCLHMNIIEKLENIIKTDENPCENLKILQDDLEKRTNLEHWNPKIISMMLKSNSKLLHFIQLYDVVKYEFRLLDTGEEQREQQL